MILGVAMQKIVLQKPWIKYKLSINKVISYSLILNAEAFGA